MKLTCPACGALMSLDVVVAHEGARAAVQAALQLPAPLSRQLIQYLTLFRPAKRQLTLDKLATLLNELLPMIHAGEIRRDGKTYRLSPAMWSAGMQEMMDRDKHKPFTRPLKTHGYLLDVLVSKANSEEAKQEARLERDRQQPSARQQAKRSGSNNPVQVATHLQTLKKAAQGQAEPELTFNELCALAQQKQQEHNHDSSKDPH